MPPVGVGFLLCEDAPARPLSACLQGEALRKRIKKTGGISRYRLPARWDGEEFGGRLFSTRSSPFIEIWEALTGRLLLGHEEEPRLRVLHHAVCCSLAILVVGLARLLLLGSLRCASRGILIALGVLQKKVALEHE